MTFPTHAPDGAAMLAPLAGRLCWRNLRDGKVLVGVLHMPPDFKGSEGPAHVLAEQGGQVRLSGWTVAGGTGDTWHSGVDALMTSRIWPTYGQLGVCVVRLLQAFPDNNIWTIYGVSEVIEPEGTPDHRWADVVRGGWLARIDAPVDPRGKTMGQLLSECAIWPGPDPALAGAGRWRNRGIGNGWWALPGLGTRYT